MTKQEKLNSPVRTFLFVREEGFYPIDLPEATVEDNAFCNPGTIRVEDALTGNVVWTAPKDESICDNCKRENPCWHADSALWNAVCRPKGHKTDPMLCPTCFIMEAKKAGFDGVWSLKLPS